MDISNSEIGSFLRCRRMWDYSSFNRQALYKPQPPALALHIGSVVHHALAAQAVGVDPIVELERYCDEEERSLAQGYQSEVGAGWSPVEVESIRQSRAYCRQLIESYFDRWSWEYPLGRDYRYISTEIGFRVPIPGTDGHFIGVVDGLAKQLSTGQVWIVEHKTYSDKPNLEKLETDYQFVGYQFAIQQLVGEELAGILYDGIGKKIPSRPKLLQNGSMSKEFIDTTAKTYLAALKDALTAAIAQVDHDNAERLRTLDTVRHELEDKQYEAACVDLARIHRAEIVAAQQRLDPKNYEAFINRLHQRDQGDSNSFWTRWRIPIQQPVLRSYEEQLRDIYLDMSDPNIRLYPVIPYFGCFDCSFRDLCTAQQRREDVQYLKETYYRTGATYHTLTSTKLEPTDVRSLADLEAKFAKEQATIQE